MPRNRDSVNTSTLHRALGVDEMFARLFRMGWTGADLKEYVETIKAERRKGLDRFSGGELSRAGGTSLYAFLLEVTAIRYILAEEEKKNPTRHPPLVKCPHGFVGSCRRCSEVSERGAASSTSATSRKE